MGAAGIAVGLNKGHVVAARKLAARPAQRKGRLGKRVKNIRELIRDVVGSAPYEKRMMELLKVGRDKRALKLAKRKVRACACTTTRRRWTSPHCGCVASSRVPDSRVVSGVFFFLASFLGFAVLLFRALAHFPS